MSRQAYRRNMGYVGYFNREKFWQKTQPEPPGGWVPYQALSVINPQFKSITVRGNFQTATEYARFGFISGLTRDIIRSSAGSQYRKVDNIHPTLWDSTARIGRYAYQSSGTLTAPSSMLEEGAQAIAVGIRRAHGTLAATMAESLEAAGYLVQRSNLLARAVNLVGRRKWRKLWRMVLHEFNEVQPPSTNVLGRYQELRRKGSRQSYTQVKSRMEDAAKKRFADPHGRSAAAGGWLEWQYAIKPLTQDVETLRDLFNGSATKSARFCVIKGKLSPVSESTVPQGTFGVYSETELVGSFKATYRVDEADLAFATITGLSDLPGATWEKFKLSFVVDWMMPIGEWLTTLTPILGLSLVDAFCSVKIVELHFGKSRTGKRVPPGIATGFVRTNVHPRAHFNVRNPFSSIERVASTVALIRQNKKFHSL